MVPETILFSNYQPGPGIQIENISFETNHNIYSTHILLTNGASYNRIVGCDFVAPVGVTGLANKGTIINNIHDGEKEEYNQIIGNKIQGGNLGILVSGNLTKRELGNEVIDIKFVGQRQAAFSCIYQEVGKFNGNSVNYEQSESAVVFSKADSSFEIIGNRIYSTGNHGLHVGYHDNLQSKDTLFIANNMISARNGVALLLENSNGVVIVHTHCFLKMTRLTL